MEKVVLVTGSARGLGASLIRTFAKNGYDVIINYNNSYDEALMLKNEVIKNYNVNALLVKADISNETEVKKMFETCTKNYKNIDVLINNAAVCCDNTIDDKTKEEFMRVLEVNVVGPFLVTKYFSKNVDIVINISSTDAVDTFYELDIDYSASKAALNSITKTFSLILPNVKIYAVMLPWINTESIKETNPMFIKKELIRTGQDRLYEPDEISDMIFSSINNNIKTGSILRWDDIHE